MDFFFPEDDLQRLAPEQTRVQSLDAQPYPDGERVRVNVEMTPFQKRPYLEIKLTDANGDEVATASIVEPMSWKLELTMHCEGDRQPLHDRSAIVLPGRARGRARVAQLRGSCRASETSRSGSVGRGAAAILAVCWHGRNLRLCSVRHGAADHTVPLAHPHRACTGDTAPPADASGLENAWLLVSIEENGYAHSLPVRACIRDLDHA